MSNGREYYFWDYENGDARPVIGFPTQADLESRANLRQQHWQGELQGLQREVAAELASFTPALLAKAFRGEL